VRSRRTLAPQEQPTKQAQTMQVITEQTTSNPQAIRPRPKNWWLRQKWKNEWTKTVTKKEAAQQGQQLPAAWIRDTSRGKKIHKGWSRPQSTIATLIRTEHIGLRAYLARQRVPDITPECTYGYRAQTLRHVMIFCPERQESRRQLFQAVGSDWKAITQTKRGLTAATKWMIQESVLEQFSLARGEENERESREERA
jgi:hypothetical protein